jgi:hypothetical protein
MSKWLLVISVDRQPKFYPRAHTGKMVGIHLTQTLALDRAAMVQSAENLFRQKFKELAVNLIRSMSRVVNFMQS